MRVEIDDLEIAEMSCTCNTCMEILFRKRGVNTRKKFHIWHDFENNQRVITWEEETDERLDA